MKTGCIGKGSMRWNVNMKDEFRRKMSFLVAYRAVSKELGWRKEKLNENGGCEGEGRLDDMEDVIIVTLLLTMYGGGIWYTVSQKYL